MPCQVRGASNPESSLVRCLGSGYGLGVKGFFLKTRAEAALKDHTSHPPSTLNPTTLKF